MAKMLYTREEIELGWIFNSLYAFWRWLLMWEIKLLPWHVRWHFVHEGPRDFSVKMRLKYYILARDRVRALQHLYKHGADIMSEVWEGTEGSEHHKDCVNVIKAKASLNIAYDAEELAFMFSCEELYEMLTVYAEHHTFSSEVLKMLLASMRGNDNNGLKVKIFKQQVIKNGLPTEIINQIFARQDGDELKSLTAEWLECHKQRVVVQNATTEEWHKFCQNNLQICAEAQMIMGSSERVETFYATGHTMAEEAIFSFFNKARCGSCDYNLRNVVHQIMFNEKEHGLCSERIKALVDSSQYLTSMLLSLEK